MAQRVWRWVFVASPILVLIPLSLHSAPVWLIFEQVWNVQIAKFAGCSAFFETAQAWDSQDGRFRPVFNTLICWESQTTPFVVQFIRSGQVGFLIIAGAYLSGAFRGAKVRAIPVLGLLLVLTFSTVPGLWQSVSNTWYSEITALTFLVLGLMTRNPLVMLVTGLLATFSKESFGVWLVAITLMFFWQRRWIQGVVGVGITAVAGWPMWESLTRPSYPSNQLNLTGSDLGERILDNSLGLAGSVAIPLLGVLTILFIFSFRPTLTPIVASVLGTGVALAAISLVHGTFRYQYVLDVTDLHALPAVYLLILGFLMWASPRQHFSHRFLHKQALSSGASVIVVVGLFLASAWEARGAYLQSRNSSEAINALLDWAASSDFAAAPTVALPNQVPPNSLNALLAIDGRFENRITPQWLYREDPLWDQAEYFVRLTPADIPPTDYRLIVPGGETGGVYRRS